MIETIFDTISRDRSQTAREWKAAGGKVVGYLSNNIPLEIIHAAGMLPFHLVGDPNQDNALANEYMEPAFDPVTRSIFNRLLRGDFDFLDAIVLPRTNDAQQRLYYYLCEIKRNQPQFKLPPVYLFNLLHSSKESTAAHNRRKVEEFAAFISKQAGLEQNGRGIDDSRLGEAIASYNRARNLIDAFTALRAQPDRDVSSTLAHRIYAAAQSLPVTEFTPALSELVEALRNAPARESAAKRFVVAGNGLDHPALHQWADELGGRIVGDFHSFGNHFLVSRVADDLDPLTALSEHYHLNTKSSRSFFDNPRELVDFAEAQRAKGILFFYLKREEALTWHYPRQNQAARDAGLQTLALQGQDYQLDSAANLASVRTFLETL